jgi:16S rRNA (cytosine967-C5)-methyltransferase
MLDIVKQLFENNVISEEVKSEIETAWQGRIQENRDQITAELREEFAQKYEHDKSAMVEAVESMLTDRLQAELVELGGTPTAFSKYGIKFDGIPNTLEPVRRRRSGVQDEGSQLVAEIFSNVAANSQRWLDLCAGPGGKAALLSSIALDTGKDFTANELSQPRAELVRQVVGSTRVWVGDGRDIASHGELFDAVLADVPCTGLGALRRRPEVRWRRTVSDLRELTALQRELSDSAISVVADGGLFAYATCSPHFAETSVAVVDILKTHPELEQIDLTEFLPQSISGAMRGKSLSLWTHRHQCDSMFMAVFRKRNE